MLTLLITEKPSVALDIAKILGGYQQRNGYLEGNDMLITWALGHLIELAMPGDYDVKFKKWAVQSLPILPDQFMLVPKNPTKKQLNTIKKLVSRPDVNRLINGCDAGREGELIFRYIIQYLDCRKPYDRLWLSETTPQAVRNAFNNLRSSGEVDNLARAAISRSQADWIIGINASRAYTCQYAEKMTVGRVQTPTLALIVNREQAINDFVPVPYYELHAKFSVNDGSYRGVWFRNKQDRFNNRGDPEEVLARLVPGMKGIISRLEQKVVQKLPPRLYNLTDLQKDANKLLGLTAEQTLNIAQKLYESKLITYPRTDSRHISSTLAATLPERLNALRNTDLAGFLLGLQLNLTSKRYVDDNKVSDHTAIIITSIAPNIAILNDNERQVYMLVARRVLGAFLSSAEYLQTLMVTVVSGETFLTKIKVVANPGWLALWPKTEAGAEDPGEQMPDLSEGDEVVLTDVSIKDNETQPPKRFTEADLLSAMENAGRAMDDENLREVMRGKGLGTPATRAETIERLVAVGYVNRQKKVLLPTDKGKRLIELVDPRLKSPEMTAEWEQSLLSIEQGRYHSKPFLDEIKNITMGIVSELKSQEPVPKSIPEQFILGLCPLCGKPVIQNRNGYGCSAWREGCKFMIWKDISGKVISQAAARRLLEKGRSDLIRGFKSKQGKVFDAYLQLKDGKVVFGFPEKMGIERSRNDDKSKAGRL